MTRCRLHRAEAVVWLVLAIIGAAVYALERLCDWGGLDDPQAWTVPPRQGGGL